MLQEIFRKIGDWNRDVRSVLALAFQTSSINFTLSFRKTRSLCEPRTIQRTTSQNNAEPEKEAKGKTETDGRASARVDDLCGRRLHLHHLPDGRTLPSRFLGESLVRRDPRSPVKKEKPSAHLRQNPVWNTVRTNAPRVAAWNSRICKSHELF